MLILRQNYGPIKVRKIELGENQTLVIGRRETCDVVIRDDYVSKRHCRIEVVDGKCFVTDLGSKAGVKLNGRRLAPDERTPFHPSDRILFCGFEFELIHATQGSRDDSKFGLGRDIRVTLEEDATTDGKSGEFSVIQHPSHSGPLRTSADAEMKFMLIRQIVDALRDGNAMTDRLDHVLELLLMLIPYAERGLVWLLKNPAHASGVYCTKVRPGSSVDPEAEVRSTIRSFVIVDGKAVLTKDGTVMCAPLLDRRGRSLGCLQFETVSSSGRLTDRDFDLLLTAASLLAFAVESSLLQRVEEEFRLAREYVDVLLPTSPADIGEYSFYARYEPANQIGGDYYDFVRLNERYLAVAVGDVVGKGLPAALVMSQAAGEIRASLNAGLDLAAIVARLNRWFCHQDKRQLTLLLLLLDVESHRVQLINAGHLPTYLRNAAGQVTRPGYEQRGMMLGVMEDYPYEVFEWTLEPGDALVLFTDGLTDAENKDNVQYGFRRIEDQVRMLTRDAYSMRGMAEALWEDIELFTGDEPQADDMCLVCIERKTRIT